MIAGICVALTVGLIDFSSFQPSFTPNEVKDVRAFWADPKRLTSVPVYAADPYQVKMTAAGSQWILQYYHLTQPGVRVLPTRDPKPATREQAEWDNFISQKFDADWAIAQAEAARLNGHPGPKPPAAPSTPPGLASLAGDPPPFAQAELARQYLVRFDDYSVVLNDLVRIRKRYPFFRYPEGVDSTGPSASWRDMSQVLKAAGLSTSQAKVMMAVSSLEGGFSTIDTYDSGGVSAGFVQFAALAEGRGSLGEMLAYMKRSAPKDFSKVFRKYGIDVTTDGYLVALDPDTGNQFVGPLANQEIISDKRLTAVFSRAGSLSTSYRVAQVKGALQRFFPRDVSFSTTVGGKQISGRLGDVFRSEAGLATLMDRYVNTGNLAAAQSAVASVIAKYGYTSVAQAANSEKELIAMLKYRRDFTTGYGLTVPGSVVAPMVGDAPSGEGVISDLDSLVDEAAKSGPVEPAKATAMLPSTPDEKAPVQTNKTPEKPATDPKPTKKDPAPDPTKSGLPETPGDEPKSPAKGGG